MKQLWHLDDAIRSKEEIESLVGITPVGNSSEASASAANSTEAGHAKQISAIFEHNMFYVLQMYLIPTQLLQAATLFTSYVLIKWLSGKIVKESLLVIKDLGIQCTSHSLGGGVSRKFHDISRIRDFIINDVSAFD